MGKGSHEGNITLHHSFDMIFDYLLQKKSSPLTTETGKNFKVISTMASRKQSNTNDKERVIIFYQKVNGADMEYARCYSCCWGHKKNCGGTWIRSYCISLDSTISQQ